MHTLLRVLGLDDLSGPFYGFWSGIGSDLSYLAILGVAWHHLNCHTDGCWRIARHRTHYCRKHGKNT